MIGHGGMVKKFEGPYQRADQDTNTIIQGIIGRLGHRQDKTYVLSIDYVESLEDLCRLLQNDEGAVIWRLGELQIVEKHLAPLLQVVSGLSRGWDGVETVLELLLVMSSMDVVADRAPSPVLLDHKRQCKKVFENAELHSALLNISVASLRHAEMVGPVLSKILRLIRNILTIPDVTNNMSNNMAFGSSFGKQIKVIEAIHKSRMFDFLIVAAASCNDHRDGRIFSRHVGVLLEIFRCIFCTVEADQLVEYLSEADIADDSALSSTIMPRRDRCEEAIQNDSPVRRPIRHGRFSGTVVVKLATGEDFLVSGPRAALDLNSLDRGKRVQRRGKKVAMLDTVGAELSIRADEKRKLCRMAMNFVTEDGFNELVRSFFEYYQEDNPDFRGLSNVYLLSAWILRLARHSSGKISLLCEVVGTEHLLSLLRALRVIVGEKSIARMMDGLQFFRETFRALEVMQIGTTAETTVAKDIIASILDRTEVSVFKLTLMNSTRMSVKMLSVVVETVHILLKLRVKTPDFDLRVGEYSSETIIDAYLRLLRNGAQNNANVNRFVAVFLTRLINDAKMTSLLFRVSVLDACHEIIYNSNPHWRKINADLIKVAKYIAKAFFHAASKDPALFIAAFFSAKVKATRQPRMVEPEAPMKQQLVLPEDWSRDEKIRWLIRMIEDNENSSILSWLHGKLEQPRDSGDICT